LTQKRKQELGSWGETEAANYLAQRGYQLISRNVRTPYGEIDIIASLDGLTVFIEVKTRASKTMGVPEISITPRKRVHMIASAEHYAMEHGIEHWQIDAISIEGERGRPVTITHFENAVQQ